MWTWNILIKSHMVCVSLLPKSKQRLKTGNFNNYKWSNNTW